MTLAWFERLALGCIGTAAFCVVGFYSTFVMPMMWADVTRKGFMPIGFLLVAFGMLCILATLAGCAALYTAWKGKLA